MGHELAPECPKESLDTGVVPTVALAAHAGDEAVRIEYALAARGCILGGFKWSLQHICCWPIGASGQTSLQAFSNSAFYEAWH